MDFNLNTEVSLFTGVVNPKNLGPVFVVDMLTTREYEARVAQVRQSFQAAASEEDTKKAKALKASTLPAWTPSGLFKGSGKSEDLIRHSGFMCLDFDYKDNKEAIGFENLTALAPLNPYIYYCGKSCSGLGYYCLVKVAITQEDPQEDRRLHEAYFKALQAAFARSGLVVDPSCKDAGRKRFVSCDREPYINTSSKVWDKLPKGYESPRKVPLCTTDGAELAVLRQRVAIVADDLVKGGKDCTEEYENWYACMQALANTFGEGGREYAHKISSNYWAYDEAEVDKKYYDCLKAVRAEGAQRYTIATLFELAKPYMSQEAKEAVFSTPLHRFKGL